MAEEKTTSRLHFEIAAGNWKKIDSFIKEYNDSPRRMTPKLKVADVINTALMEFLTRRKDD